MCDRSRGRGPYPELACGRQVGGGVDIAAQARPGSCQLDSARTAVPRGRIRPEPRVQRGAERTQYRGAGPKPVGDEAAPMVHTAVVLGRPGPEFRPSEVARLGYLAGIVATMLR